MESGIVPKLIVLFFGDEKTSVPLAESAAEGAKGVRFTEVDVRSGTAATTRHPRLESAHAITHYDGVVIVTAIASPDAMQPELAALLDELERGSQMSNTVFGLATDNGAVLGRVAQLGGIIVSERGGGDQAAHATRVGARVAKVIGWVRHSLGHEADPHHHPGQSHGHTH